MLDANKLQDSRVTKFPEKLKGMATEMTRFFLIVLMWYIWAKPIWRESREDWNKPTGEGPYLSPGELQAAATVSTALCNMNADSGYYNYLPMYSDLSFLNVRRAEQRMKLAIWSIFLDPGQWRTLGSYVGHMSSLSVWSSRVLTWWAVVHCQPQTPFLHGIMRDIIELAQCYWV